MKHLQSKHNFTRQMQEQYTQTIANLGKHEKNPITTIEYINKQGDKIQYIPCPSSEATQPCLSWVLLQEEEE